MVHSPTKNARDKTEWNELLYELPQHANLARLESPFGSVERDDWQKVVFAIEDVRNTVREVRQEKKDADSTEA